MASKTSPTKIKPLSPEVFTREVIATLTPLTNKKNQPWMVAYMKGKFPYLGIKTPQLRAAVSPLLNAQKNSTAANLLRTARQLWQLPEREYQYVAIGLLSRNYKQLSSKNIPALLSLAQKKSWWDSVDSIASIISKILRAELATNPHTQLCMDTALTSNNLWVRRIAVIHQLGWRAHTDTDRLFTYALTLAHEKDFFIRKAIGWALRDHARHAPAKIRAFLRANKATLSPLTQREAAKHL